MVINKTFVRIPQRDSPRLTVQILGSFREVFGEGEEECSSDASLVERPITLAVALESGDHEGACGDHEGACGDHEGAGEENSAEMSVGKEGSTTASTKISPLHTNCAYVLTVFLYS